MEELRHKGPDPRPKTQDSGLSSVQHLKSSIFLLCLVSCVLCLASYVRADSSLTHNVGKVEMLVSDWGALTRVENGSIFPNFGYAGKNYLDPFSEIWVGNSIGIVASAYDESPTGTSLGEWQATTPSGQAEYVPDHPNASQSIHTQYAPDRYRDFPFSITVDQHTYAWDSTVYPDDDDYIIMKLVLTNRGVSELRDFFLAIQTNWDVDYSEERDDLVDWDNERLTGIAYDSDGTDPMYFALALVSGKFASHNIVDVSTWKYEDSDRSVLMSNGETDDLDTIGNRSGNYLNVISAGPYNIPPEESVSVIYAFAAGRGISELRKNLDAAKRRIITPGKLAASPTKEAVNLTWPRGISPDVEFHKVYRSNKSGSDYSEIATISSEITSYRDTHTEVGTEYYYVVTAVDLEGNESYYSNEVHSSPGIPPPPPRNLTIKIGVSQNPVLHWDSPADIEITGYKVFRNFTGSDPWTAITTVDTSVQSFVDHNVYDGDTYYYTVASTNIYNWTSDFSNVVTATIDRPGTIDPAANLDAVKVTPNPHRLSSHGKIRFVNLTHRAEIRIYTLTGELVKVLYHVDGSGEEEWDLRNDKDEILASGVYVYHVESLKAEETGKITAIGKLAVIW